MKRALDLLTSAARAIAYPFVYVAVWLVVRQCFNHWEGQSRRRNK
jgi:hypothetical protein